MNFHGIYFFYEYQLAQCTGTEFFRSFLYFVNVCECVPGYDRSGIGYPYEIYTINCQVISIVRLDVLHRMFRFVLDLLRIAQECSLP